MQFISKETHSASEEISWKIPRQICEGGSNLAVADGINVSIWGKLVVEKNLQWVETSRYCYE